MSSYYIYIIYSESKDQYYTGYSYDPELRLKRHNDGWSKSTKSGIPWKLMYTEEYPSKSEAIKRENEIKSMKSRKYIESLIEDTD